MNQTILVADKL